MDTYSFREMCLNVERPLASFKLPNASAAHHMGQAKAERKKGSPAYFSCVKSAKKSTVRNHAISSYLDVC